MDVRGYRAAMSAGIAFPILLFVGVNLLLGSSPDTNETDTPESIAKKWVAVVANDDRRLKMIIGSFVMMVAALALLWFAAALRGRFAGPGSPMYGFAALAAAGVALSMTPLLGVVGGFTFGNEALSTDGNAIRAVADIALPLLLVVFGLASSAFILSVCACVRRAGWPRWIVYFGYLAALAGVFGVIFIPMLLVLLWYLAAGIVGLTRVDAAAGVAAA